jgi:hypothetical protein
MTDNYARVRRHFGRLRAAELERDTLRAQLATIHTPDVPPTADQIMADPRVKALVEAATPYISPIQNADYARQLRERDALVAAIAQLKEQTP